ncbi:hypothetical protein EYR40_005380 [Pleurotus pulmonarius]|nr:hypothetical protein EYR36_006234 [Pleurotus pulmonarius]KAF4600941.1 hypothetical protein EYR38_005587 [Pleurotus pulmonarius]KAF4602176.1 hypothetical protein EYR40_005380 [Pleurotus pulmonarius]
MVLSVVARRVAVAGVRSIHTTAPVRSAGHDYHHLPFAWPGNKKTAFGLKLTSFLLFGFSIPVVASVYQLKKSS